MRGTGTGREPFPAIDDVGAAVAPDAGTDIGCVRGCNLGLGHAERRADRSVQQRFQPLPLLFRRTVSLQCFHVAGVGRGAIEDFRRPKHAAHDLRQRRVFEIGQPPARFRMRQEQIPEAQSLGFRLEVLDKRQRFPPVLGDLELLPVEVFTRIDVLLHERPQAIPQLSNFRRKFKAHFGEKPRHPAFRDPGGRPSRTLTDGRCRIRTSEPIHQHAMSHSLFARQAQQIGDVVLLNGRRPAPDGHDQDVPHVALHGKAMRVAIGAQDLLAG